MANNRSVLFILKKRENYNFPIGEYDAPYDSISTGMFNSSKFVNDMLVDEGITSNLSIVNDNNDIDREVTLYQPRYVIIEGYWVVPEKFDVLKALHPTVTWIIRCHSELPFLAQEGVAIDWTIEYLSRGISVAGNSKRIQREIRSIARSCDLLQEVDLLKQTPLLTNYYPTSFTQPAIKSLINNVINIGCFGAIRPLKNQLMPAVAAIEFAEQHNLSLRYHINANRVEMNGSNALKNIRALFAKQPIHSLVEHDWETHDNFLELVASMDMCLQVSFTETFNITVADAVSKGIPTVVSKEIAWAAKPYADPTSSQNIIAAMNYVFLHGFDIVSENQTNLLSYLDVSKVVWKQYIVNEINLELTDSERLIPINGMTDHPEHKIYIKLSHSLPTNGRIVIYRNDIEIGNATADLGSTTEFYFIDNTPLPGQYIYTSRVIDDINASQLSNGYTINMVQV